MSPYVIVIGAVVIVLLSLLVLLVFRFESEYEDELDR